MAYCWQLCVWRVRAPTYLAQAGCCSQGVPLFFHVGCVLAERLGAHGAGWPYARQPGGAGGNIGVGSGRGGGGAAEAPPGVRGSLEVRLPACLGSCLPWGHRACC